MTRPRFDAELASEMTWEECILYVLDLEKSSYTAQCSVCLSSGCFSSQVEREVVEEFINKGWRYVRLPHGFEALCPNCKKQPRKR